MREEGVRTWLRWVLKWAVITTFLLALILPIAHFIFLSVSTSMLEKAHALLEEPESVVYYKGLAASQGGESDLPIATTTQEILDDWGQLFDELDRINAQIAEMSVPNTGHTLEIALKSDDQLTEEERVISDKWMAEIDQQYEYFVTAHENFIYAIREMAARGGPVYPIDIADYQNCPPHYSQLRECARLLAKHARLKAEQELYEESVADIIAGLQLAEAIANEPLFIAHGIQSALRGMMNATLQQTYKGMDCATADPLITYLSALSHQDSRGQFKEMLIAETMQSLSYYDRLRQGDKKELEQMYMGEDVGRVLGSMGAYDPDAFQLRDITRPIYSTFVTSSLAHPFINRDEAIFIWAMNNLTEQLAHRPFYEAISYAYWIEDEMPITFIQHPYLSMLPRILEKQARIEVILDHMLLALTLERYQEENGSYPDTLDGIVSLLEKKLPLDPYSGNIYRYVHVDEGYKIFSVGWNGVDDQGVHDIMNGDIVWPSE